MSDEPLSVSLTREHHEIDDGIAKYVGGGSPGEHALRDAITELRRHIYLWVCALAAS